MDTLAMSAVAKVLIMLAVVVVVLVYNYNFCAKNRLNRARISRILASES